MGREASRSTTDGVTTTGGAEGRTGAAARASRLAGATDSTPTLTGSTSVDVGATASNGASTAWRGPAVGAPIDGGSSEAIGLAVASGPNPPGSWP
jgi:hypothetical protein